MQYPISWDNPMDCILIGPELLQDMEQIVRKVQKKLKGGTRPPKELCRFKDRT